ncbi:MAG: hypothetical protein CVV27_14390 [Candidatus Melainabacteria bacterium HGW-Melainabacteria-1]|nr:MAG: hypothetical protein CVV27_14390 [Candidatus Melainabacteria bacterium HGW-Melainabacteria-1]
MSERLGHFKQRAEAIEQDVRALLLEVRAYLDESEHAEFYAAESDLYDAGECLQDFAESCAAELEALK